MHIAFVIVYFIRRNCRTRFNFVYFVLLAESTKFSSIWKLCTHTSVCDIAVAVRKFIAYESSGALEYEIFTRTKISAITIVTSPSSNNMSTVYTQTRILNHALPVFLHCSIITSFFFASLSFSMTATNFSAEVYLAQLYCRVWIQLIVVHVCVCVCVLAEKELETAFLPARSIWLSILQFRSSESIFLYSYWCCRNLMLKWISVSWTWNISCLWLQGIEHPISVTNSPTSFPCQHKIIIPPPPPRLTSRKVIAFSPGLVFDQQILSFAAIRSDCEERSNSSQY